MATDNKLIGIEVATRLTARALDDLGEEVGALEVAIGRVEAKAATAATATDTLRAEIATLRGEIAASRTATEAAVSLLKDLESKSLPSRIAAWALANPIPAVVIVALLLLAQSGYSYMIPQILGASNANPLLHTVPPAPSPAPAREP